MVKIRTRFNTSIPALWLLAVVACCGVVLRFWGLGRDSFSFDEMAAMLLWQQDQVVSATTGALRRAPLYPLLLQLFNLPFSQSEWLVRLPSALFGALSVASVVLLRGIVPVRALLVLAALLSSNFSLIYFSQDARSYAMVSFFCTLALVFLLRCLQLRSKWDAIGLIFSAEAAALTHYVSLFLLVPCFAVLFLRQPKRGFMTGLGFVVLFGPWFGYHVWLGGGLSPAEASVAVTASLLQESVRVLFAGPVLMGVLGAWCAAAIVCGVAARDKNLVNMLLVLGGVVALLVLAHLRGYDFRARYFTCLLPLVFLLLAVGERYIPLLPKMALPLFLSVVLYAAHHANVKTTKQDWRGMAQLVKHFPQCKGVSIPVYTKWDIRIMQFYFPEKEWRFEKTYLDKEGAQMILRHARLARTKDDHCPVIFIHMGAPGLVSARRIMEGVGYEEGRLGRVEVRRGTVYLEPEASCSGLPNHMRCK